ncbi:MAG TPA: peptidoglycan-binding domain-containing protein [Terriglobales bacterium]|nr:peptidoglycan-binding domain-containing protein [Terriglobales bacterium]
MGAAATDTTAASHAHGTPKQPTKAVSASGKKSHSSGKKSSRTGKKSRKVAHGRSRGQQKIDSERTQQIQEALIREHYLNGDPTGKWDDATQKALQKYQADNGWQSKTVPDARALIKLGLGPNHDHLLNPESAMTSAPQNPRHAPATDPLAGSSPATQPQHK